MAWFSKKKSGEAGAPASLARVSQALESLGYQGRTLDDQRYTFNHGDVPMLVVEQEDQVSIGSMVQAHVGGVQTVEAAQEWVMEFNHHNLAPTMFVQVADIDGVSQTLVVGEFRILRRIDFTAEQLQHMVTVGIDAVAVGLQSFLTQAD